MTYICMQLFMRSRHKPLLLSGILCSLLLVLLTGCGFQNSAASPSNAVPLGTCTGGTPQAGQKGTDLANISLLSASTGWATRYGTQDGPNGTASSTGISHILRTTDGGCHWQAVRTWQQDAGVRSGPFFISETRTVLALARQLQTTSDGGKTWSTQNLPLNKDEELDVRDVTFLDQNTGWLLGNLLKRDTYRQMPDNVLFHTTDGGKTWTLLQHINSAHVSPGDIRPTALQSVHFITASQGWLTGTASIPGSQEEHEHLFTTQDGGKSWQLQTLPTPQGAKTLIGLHLGKLQFFSAQEAILPAAINSSSDTPNGFFNYASHDGGKTWQGQTFHKFDYNTDIKREPGTVMDDMYRLTPVPRFVSAQAGWDGSNNDVLFKTTTGGQSWQQVQLNLPEGAQVQFVTETIGYALSFSHQGDTSTHLYRTEDAGKTWRKIPYTVA